MELRLVEIGAVQARTALGQHSDPGQPPPLPSPPPWRPWHWLTVGPKSQPDLEIVLMKIAPGPQLSQEAANSLRELVREGALGAAAFDTADCRATYEELKAKGVEFSSPPTEQFYGIEATFRDVAGNWFSLTQPKPH